MSISYGIIACHHGKISVESEPGQTTTFTIDLQIDNGLQCDSNATIYMVTAYTEPIITQDALDAGAKDVINKLVGFPEISEKVMGVLGGVKMVERGKERQSLEDITMIGQLTIKERVASNAKVPNDRLSSREGKCMPQHRHRVSTGADTYTRSDSGGTYSVGQSINLNREEPVVSTNQYRIPNKNKGGHVT